MRIMTIIGARPQFIKCAAVSAKIAESPEISEVLVHTGQHYDANMSDLFFAELGIPSPALHLGIGSGSHGEQTGRMLAAIEAALLRDRPDWVMVYGDTNSTLAGALAAVKLHIPVAHVEAGLRSFNRRMPEEINRVAADHFASLLFAPTDAAVANLKREGIAPARIVQCGDVMYDLALRMAGRAEATSRILDRLGLTRKGFITATVHRAENTDDPARLGAIIEALSVVARELPVVLPLHPRTRDRLSASRIEPHGITVIDPVGYLDMTALIRNASLVATDSGGLQKEAFFHGVPCVTLREETEWIELVDAGWNRLAPPTSAPELTEALRQGLAEGGPDAKIAPYGDGNAAGRIVAALLAAEVG